MPRDAQAIKEKVGQFEDAEVDELILDPTIGDLMQVDLPADVVL